MVEEHDDNLATGTIVFFLVMFIPGFVYLSIASDAKNVFAPNQVPIEIASPFGLILISIIAFIYLEVVLIKETKDDKYFGFGAFIFMNVIIMLFALIGGAGILLILVGIKYLIFGIDWGKVLISVAIVALLIGFKWALWKICYRRK